MKKYLLSILAVSLFAIVGCEQKGPAQKAGERTDEIIDNVKNGEPPLKEKGPFEKTGKAVDDTLKNKDSK